MHDQLQPIFRGLADPARRAIIDLLQDEPSSISTLSANFDLSRNAVVKHLKILEEAGLIVGKSVGRERINYLQPQGLSAAHAWLSQYEEFWDSKLDALKRVIEEDNE